MKAQEKRAIKRIVMDVLKSRIARENEINAGGSMFGRWPDDNLRKELEMRDRHIDITGNIITLNGTPIYKIIRRYAARKTCGFYRELTPELAEIV